ncbi:TPA: hypothetical protein R2K53_005559 [Raoultella ornithinolytica]|nr:hypothetical protein [Raoultella ornithinolytica]
MASFDGCPEVFHALLTVRLTGNVAGIMKLLNRCGWQAEPESGASLPHQFSLMARQGVTGKGD